METKTRGRQITESTLIWLPGAAVAFGAIIKFAGLPGPVHEMAADGFSGGKLMFVAALELASAVLYLTPRTRSLGLLIFSAFLGGAVCVHVQVGEYFKVLPPGILLALAWAGCWLRYPQLRWSFSGREAAMDKTLGDESRNLNWGRSSR